MEQYPPLTFGICITGRIIRHEREREKGRERERGDKRERVRERREIWPIERYGEREGIERRERGPIRK